MQSLTDFTWEILGTSHGQIPTSPIASGEVKMSLYDSGYSYKALCTALKKDDRAPEEINKNFRKIVAGEDNVWKLWLVTIYANRIAFDFCRHDGNNMYHFELKSPKMLGLRFLTYPCIKDRTVTRTTTCLIWGDRTGNCRTQIEEFHDGHMVTSMNLYYNA